MNEQNAKTPLGEATLQQLRAAIYTLKDNETDYAVRRELNRAAGHIACALVHAEDPPVEGEDVFDSEPLEAGAGGAAPAPEAEEVTAVA